MRRSVFTVEQDDFRSMVRDFLIKEVEPDYAKWEEAGHVPRELYRRLGDLGVLAQRAHRRAPGSIGKWHAKPCELPAAVSAGISSRQRSWARGQRG